MRVLMGSDSQLWVSHSSRSSGRRTGIGFKCCALLGSGSVSDLDTWSQVWVGCRCAVRVATLGRSPHGWQHNRLVQALPVCLLVNRQFSQRQATVVLIRDLWTCKACGERLTRATAHIDHIFPWSRGGTTSVLNAQALCQRCNLTKGASLHVKDQATKVAATGRGSC